MKHPHIRTGRSLAGMVLILFGLSAYGCGDSATVTEPASLGNLSVSEGTLTPRFSPDTTSYTVQLSTDVSSTTITATPRVAGDTIRIDNQPVSSKTVTLDSPGAEESVNIVVTETGTGGTSKSYTVRIRRDLEDNSLQALSVSSGTLSPSPFDKNTLNYSVNGVGASVTNITISATKSDQDSIMQIGSVTVPAGTPSGQAIVQLGTTGSATPVSIDITRPSGSRKTYTVTINRGPSDNSFLRSLTLPSGLRLNPGFRSSTTAYTVDVANNVTTIAVTPTAQDTTARITVNGLATDSGQRSQPIPLNEPGVNDSRTIINITVIAQDNTERVYTVTVIRAALGGNNNLSALTVRQSTSSPNLINFSLNTTSYTVGVESSVSTITVTPTLQDSTATLTVTSNGPGPITTSGQVRTIPLRAAGLSTTINIVVRAQNGSEKPYTITVDRATPPPPSGNNNLSALTVRQSTSSPNLINFSLNTTSYTVDVGSGVSTIIVTPTLQDPAATLTVTSNGPGPITTSGQARTIPLRAAGLSTTINIVVRAQNGSEKPYTITVDRATPPPPSGNNNLQNLTTAPGTLTPLFDVNRIETDYAVTDISSSATSILVIATPQDSNATVLINTQAGNSRSIPLPTGPSTTNIDVLVRAPNGNERPYSITVTQPAPAAPPAPPANAPDLLTADDSCPLKPLSVGNETFTNDDCLVPEPTPENPNPAPAGTRDDDKTNVATPRFVIPQPSAGHTPNLYVDGNKVGSVFDAANNTLRPTTPLSGNNNGIEHSITSTVTNTATTLESEQSDDLTITIHTGGQPF